MKCSEFGRNVSHCTSFVSKRLSAQGNDGHNNNAIEKKWNGLFYEVIIFLLIYMFKQIGNNVLAPRKKYGTASYVC